MSLAVQLGMKMRMVSICWAYATHKTNSLNLVRETYIYVITTIDTVEGYRQIFQAMFKWLGKLGGYEVCWHHAGHMRNRPYAIQAITCDMDTKQARGMKI